jgi:hypothetical protein
MLHEYPMEKSHPKNGAEPHGGVENRRTRRIPLSFQIEVSGRDVTGVKFREPAVTMDVNRHGCRFHFLRELRAGDPVEIQRVWRNAPWVETKPFLFQVVWVDPTEHGWAIGATSPDGVDIWQISFPANKDYQ